ncbi:MAG: chorismate synthase, partial [Clostridia bacterium]|nr:chorismate synthase [Clostridia bacterium]
MKSNFENLQIEIYGESHAPEIGVRIGGIPSDCELTLNCVDNLLERRRSHGEAWATPRKEDDVPEIVSGLKKCARGYTVDGTIELRIKNSNVRPNDYANTVSVPRPSHADYAAYSKDGKISSGGGRFSGRMTAPLCIAGGIAQELLEVGDISITAYISE